jgi:hypothetical protein
VKKAALKRRSTFRTALRYCDIYLNESPVIYLWHSGNSGEWRVNARLWAKSIKPELPELRG